MKKMLTVFLIFLGGCFLFEDPVEENIATISDPIYISSSSAKVIELQDGELVDIYEEEEDEVSTSIMTLNAATLVENFEYDIRYIARVLPVDVNGLHVQANDIIIKGNQAFVAYNFAGELFKGAVQIINIEDADSPEITDEIIFDEMDINTLYLDGNTLVFGGASNPEIYESKSFIGVIENVNSIDIDSIEESLTFFSDSHGVTAITEQGNNYYISVGAEGGRIYMTDSNYTVEATFDKADVRDMEEYKNGVVAIKGTTDNDEDAKIMLITDDEIVEELELSDFSSDYNKVTIEMYNQELAFIGMSSLGFQVYDIGDDDALTSVFSLDNPDDDAAHVTNSVSYDSNLVFVANGEYGVRIIDIKDITKNNSDFADLLGFIDFEGLENEIGDNYSANHVAFKSRSLFVASGVGGVNIYTVDEAE